RLLIVSPDSRAYRARRQAETPLNVLCRFPEPALLSPELMREFYGWRPCDGARPLNGGGRKDVMTRDFTFEGCDEWILSLPGLF
ncbi:MULTISPECIES: hypothetical protein, partial [unclassified Bradyrhizobium]|uniref:hypothetical protein n=1 Tax=unclassified Bradyrhizobium TaxID=2631580 RepID=UPI001FFA094A